MGERLNISLDKGVHRTPTIGEEGQLSECVNMIPRNGQLTPLRAPSEHYHYVSDRYHLLYIHENAGYKHYIHAVELTDNLFKLYWSDDDPAGEIGVGDMTELTGITVGSLDNIYHISHIGNTVIFLTDSGVKMQVFKGDGYKYLSGQIPEINLSFGLKTWLANEYADGVDEQDPNYHPCWSWTLTAELQDISPGSLENVNRVVKAKRNSMLSNITSEGYWTFPFFVRYALVMKDGTLVHCSAPVLMTPSTDNPLCLYRYKFEDIEHPIYKKYELFIAKARLQMFFSDSELQVLQQYNDIIDGVAIYVSEQIWTIEQDKDYKQGRWAFLDSNTPITTKGGMSFGEFQEYSNESDKDYEPSTMLDLMGYKGLIDEPDNVHIEDISVVLENPRKDAATIDSEIKSCNNFYLLKEYTLDELSSLEGDRIEVSFPLGKLTNISSYQKMAEEMELRDYYVAKSGFVYNRRLNISNLHYKISNPLAQSTLVNYIEKSGRENDINLNSEGKPTFTIRAPQYIAGYKYQQKVQVKHDGQVRIINNSETPILNLASGAFYYLAVPFVGANKIWIHSPQTTTGVELSLAQHDLLDVSYYYQGFGDVVTESEIELPDDNDDYLTKNALMQSLVENPWVFPKELEAIVGNGQIIGMAAAIKALSVGQYGQFPLIVFATDGIWTLQINDDGTYKPATFLSGDVCTNPASITQTDNAVLFVTKQGLKVVDGSDVRLLSLPIEGNNIPDGTFIPTNSSAAAWADIVIDESVDKRLSLQNCNCLFDYTDRLLHIFNDDKKHDCMTLDGGEFASEVNHATQYDGDWGEPHDVSSRAEFTVGEWHGQGAVSLTQSDIYSTNASSDDKVHLSEIKLIAEWNLTDGVLKTHNTTFGGTTHDIHEIQLYLDVSLIDSSEKEIMRYSVRFTTGVQTQITQSRYEFVHIPPSDSIDLIKNSGSVKYRFNSIMYNVAIGPYFPVEGEYFQPQLGFSGKLQLYIWHPGTSEVIKMGKPSRIIARNPESLFQVGAGVFGYTGYNADIGSRLGYAITRPIAFGDFAKFKTILDMRLYDQIANRGARAVAADNGCWVVLWASNDETHWFRINSLHGSSFKFFRIAIITRLGKDDTLSGLSIEYEERRGTKMR